MKAAGVSIARVNVSYGRHRVLKDVDLEIEPGEFFAFLGPSGCGKTTLLRLIAGFVQADSGSVRLAGADIAHLPPWKRDVGLVFQSYALWPHMSVRRNVAFGLEERRLPRAEVERRVDGALEVVGLADLAERKPSQLSGGQQQRVALARTLAVEPKVLLLDEPLSNLDAQLRVQVRRELRELQRRLGLTTIFVTHDQEEANTVCDRIAVMSDGVVQQVGTPMALYTRPANRFVAGFLGSANILEGRVSGQGEARRFEIAGGGSLPVPPDVSVPPAACLVFRPQDARCVDVPAAPADAMDPTPALAGRIVEREFLGAGVRYTVRTGATDLSVDVPFLAGDTPRVTGQDVLVSVPASAVRFVPG